MSKALEAHAEKMAALRALEDRGGRITPVKLVTAARDKDHAFHDDFEWDDQKAAESHRLDQARSILRTWIPARVEGEHVIVRAPTYVRDPTVASDEQGYIRLSKVKTNEDLSREVLVQEFSRAASALQRAYDIAVALEAKDSIAGLIESVNRLRDQFRPEL